MKDGRHVGLDFYDLLIATKFNQHLLGWVLPPLVICAVEAHLVKFVNWAWYF
jgi:hypothetical protein